MSYEYKCFFDLKEVQSSDIDIELHIIIAMLNGCFQNKEILCFINKYQYVKFSTIEYNVKKLLKKFGVVTRSELFQKLLKERIISFSFNPNSSFYKDNYHITR